MVPFPNRSHTFEMCHYLSYWVFLLQDMQDIEFTIEQGKLYMLQTRTGKRTAHAALQIAVDMVEEIQGVLKVLGCLEWIRGIC